jgi:ABC-type phosphate transport system substrate-binding protein
MLLLTIAAWALLAYSQGDSTDIAVIVNPANPVDSISSLELRKIFAGNKQSWSSSLAVFVLVRAPQAHERDVLLSRILRMNESEYKEYWVRKVFSGDVQHEPLAVLSNGVQLEAVRSDKGGIALVKLGDVRQGVKILKLDGRMPGTDGYSLK